MLRNKKIEIANLDRSLLFAISKRNNAVQTMKKSSARVNDRSVHLYDYLLLVN